MSGLSFPLAIFLGNGGSGSGISSGTANPGSPATNALFFRTDLGLLIYYTGVRWLTVNEYVLPMPVRDALEPFSVGTVTSALYTAIDTSNGGMWLVRWVVTTYMATNDGSNFSTFSLKPVIADGTLGTAVASFDTSADAAINYVTHVTAIGTGVAATTKTLALTAVKTGTPGNAYAHAVVIYRMIVT